MGAAPQRGRPDDKKSPGGNRGGGGDELHSQYTTAIREFEAAIQDVKVMFHAEYYESDLAFQLGRHARAVCTVHDLPLDPERFEGAVRAWASAREGVGADELYEAFFFVAPTVLIGAGDDIVVALRAVLEMSALHKQGLVLGSSWKFPTPGFRRLAEKTLEVCVFLAGPGGKRTFPLPGRVLAEVLGCNQWRAAKILSVLSEGGFLTKKGGYSVGVSAQKYKLNFDDPRKQKRTES